MIILSSYKTINKAYNLSKKAHANQLRGSGEEYFTHPLAVADYFVIYETRYFHNYYSTSS